MELWRPVSWMMLLAVATMFSAGCDSSGENAAPVDMNDMANALNRPPAAPSGSGTGAGAEQPDGGAESAAPDAAPGQAASSDDRPTPSRQESGRATVEPGGYYSSIVGARRHILNRLDDLAWTQAVQHFEAEHGRLPRDHAEFMSAIVERHGIDLGYIEENQEFLYDPSEGRWGTVYVVEKQSAP